jgi:DNA-binding XRE family transcriptional regulator
LERLPLLSGSSAFELIGKLRAFLGVAGVFVGICVYSPLATAEVEEEANQEVWPMTSVITPINDGFAEALDSPLSKTVPWEARSPSNIRLGNRLHLVRISHGISEKEFSEQLEIDRDDLDLYESGGKRVSANLLLRIAKLLDVQLEYFFQD